MQALKSLFLDELADRYDAEKRVIRALPKMKRTATCEQLQRLLQLQLREAAGHVRKLEAVFNLFQVKPKPKKCEATIGLLKEGDDLASKYRGSPAINAAVVSIAQKLEHYEIASYGCLREWAALLGNQEATSLLAGILEEEKASNQALIALARSRCNQLALAELTEAGAARYRLPAKTSILPRRLRPVSLKRRLAIPG